MCREIADKRERKDIDMPNRTVMNLTLVVAVIALASVCAIAQTTPGELNLTGTVTCEGRIMHRYTCQRNQTQQTCTLACVEQGSRFVMMVGDKPYLLEGNRRELEAYAGGRATITGLAVNDRIEVKTASNAKHYTPVKGNAQPSSMGANASTTPEN